MKTERITETREVCTLCGGRGIISITVRDSETCRLCGGSGQRIVRVITERQSFDIDEITDAVSRRVMDRIVGHPKRGAALDAAMKG